MYHSDYEAWVWHRGRIEEMTADVRRYRLAKLARAGRRLLRGGNESTQRQRTQPSEPTRPTSPSNTTRSVPGARAAPGDQIDRSEPVKPATTTSGREPSREEPNPSARQPVGCALNR